MSIYKEYVIALTYEALSIRVWIDIECLERITPSGLHSKVADLPEDLSYESVANVLIELPGVNAVEVKDYTGDGVVYYKDWP